MSIAFDWYVYHDGILADTYFVYYCKMVWIEFYLYETFNLH